MLALQIALGFGIAVIMPFLAYQATCTFFPVPEKVSRYTCEGWQRNLFFVSCGIGLLVLAVGPLLPARAVGAGFMFGGIFCIVEGVACYWPTMHQSIKFLFLLLALGALVAIGFKYLA